MSIASKIEEAADFLRSRTRKRPPTGIVLGSGLGPFADRLEDADVIPYESIPHFPRSSVPGHAGRLVVGSFRGTPLAVMAGRVHAYEGYGAFDVVFPARVLAKLGVGALVLTNAAGAVNTAFSPGDLMVIEDHLNLTGLNPLVGPEEPALGERFTDLSRAYDPKLQETCERAARTIGLALRRGVYAGLLGPSFETPAEIRMLRSLGADAVGMSTVLETIAARQMGVRVLGLSCITNMAAGILSQPIDHEEVLEIGLKVQSVFIELLEAVIPEVHKQG